jgi:hypothetical protein
MMTGAEPGSRCSFCAEVARPDVPVIAGPPGVSICYACVEDIVEERGPVETEFTCSFCRRARATVVREWPERDVAICRACIVRCRDIVVENPPGRTLLPRATLRRPGWVARLVTWMRG